MTSFMTSLMSSQLTRIRLGESPGHLVWDDGTCFAILNTKPISEGHLLVVPYQEVDHWDEMDQTLNAHCFDVASRLSRTLRALFPCEKVGMMIAGLETRHAHIHLLPISALSDLNFALARERDDTLQSATANRIRQALRDAGQAHVTGD